MNEWREQMAKRAGAVGIAGLLIGVAGAFIVGREQFFRSYLLGFVFWVGIAFGCLGIQMIHALTGGRWGMPIRRLSLAASTTLPLFFVLFVPIFLGLDSIYPWARPEAADDPLLHHKAVYLSPLFFGARAAVCLAAWSVVAVVLYQRTLRRGLDRSPSAKMRVVSGPGLLVCVLTMSVAAVDWLMSLDPHWYSTMFGVIVMVGQLLGAMCFLITLLLWQARVQGVKPDIDPLHDLGNLLLVFVMLWAYVSFSQYLIVYGGNIAEEVPWYIHRSTEGWERIALALIVFHFAVPFLILVSRRSKRSPRMLAVLAGALLVMRFVEMFWTIAPNFHVHGFALHWLDVVLPIGVGGVWVAFFFHRYGSDELAPTAPSPAGTES